MAKPMISSAMTPFTFSRTESYLVKVIIFQPRNGTRASVRRTASPET